MIPAIPLPSFGHLLALRYLRSPAATVLAQPWLRAGDLGALWLSRSSWSLAAVADAFHRLHGRKPVVAVPDYICNQSLWPLRQDRAALVFYPIHAESLTPDWDACDQLGQVDLFVLVHYFGWANDGAGAREFCDRRGAWLVEDAAHVLAPIAGIGEHGDAVLYSPHKLLAVPDGAVLVVRESLRAAEHHLVDAVQALGLAHPPTTNWRTKRLIQCTPMGALLARLRPGGQSSFTTDPATIAMAITPAPSGAGAALIARADLAAIAAKRAANAQALAEAITAQADWAPLCPLRGDVAPYRLVMRCNSPAVAAARYDRLRGIGIAVESWPDLAPEILPDSAARRLRETLLLLPCHQGLNTALLCQLAAAA